VSVSLYIDPELHDLEDINQEQPLRSVASNCYTYIGSMSATQSIPKTWMSFCVLNL